MPPLQQSNYHSQLSSNFGRSALETLRKVERKTISLAKWKNHLHFSLSCKRHSVFPVSLAITCPVKGARADAILQRTKKALLRERVRQTIMAIRNIQKDIHEAMSHFTNTVDAETLHEAKQRLVSVENSTFNKTRQKQKTKLEKLLSTQSSLATESHLVTRLDEDEAKSTKERWVVNASSKQLTNAHKSILQQGLAFAPTPISAPTVDLIVAVETGAGIIGGESEEASIMRAMAARVISNQRKPPASNISRDKRAALQDLRDDKSITILPADKGRATVILDKSNYIQKIDELLSNTNTY